MSDFTYCCLKTASQFVRRTTGVSYCLLGKARRRLTSSACSCRHKATLGYTKAKGFRFNLPFSKLPWKLPARQQPIQRHQIRVQIRRSESDNRGWLHVADIIKGRQKQDVYETCLNSSRDPAEPVTIDPGSLDETEPRLLHDASPEDPFLPGVCPNAEQDQQSYDPFFWMSSSPPRSDGGLGTNHIEMDQYQLYNETIPSPEAIVDSWLEENWQNPFIDPDAEVFQWMEHP